MPNTIGENEHEEEEEGEEWFLIATFVKLHVETSNNT